MQHLKTAKDRSKFSELREGETALTNTLKIMLIRGLVPIVFIGIPEARDLLFNDAQFAGRCVAEIDYSSLDWTIPSEREMFENYCGRVGLKLQKHGLFEQASQFLSEDIPICLHAASSGRIGMVSRIVEKPTAPASPWQNGFAERLIGSIRRECVDHIIVLGEAHLRRTLKSYAAYYNSVRTHRSLHKDAPASRPVQRSGVLSSRAILGGLHHHYARV